MNKMGPQADIMRWILSSIDIGCQLTVLGKLVAKRSRGLTLSEDVGILNLQVLLKSEKGSDWKNSFSIG